MSLEGLVRPFQTGDFSPPRIDVSQPPDSVPNIRLELGKSGTGKTVSSSASISFSCYMAKVRREAGGDEGEGLRNPLAGTGRRKETPKRIRNPQDRTQWVDVYVTDAHPVVGGRGPSYQEVTVIYDNAHAQGDDVPDPGEPPIGGTTD